MSHAVCRFPRVHLSMLTAGVVALAAACSGEGARGVLSTAADGAPAVASLATPSAAPVTAASAGSAAPSLVRSPEAAAQRANRASPAGVQPEASAPAALESPMLALNQMVTAQALLVSLLLAPLSKEAAEGPVARVDAAPASAPTR